jgi:hypothetical protein
MSAKLHSEARNQRHDEGCAHITNAPVCTENVIRVDDVTESLKLAE